MESHLSLLLHCTESLDQVTQATQFLAKRYHLPEEVLLKNPDLHWVNPDTDPENGAIKIEQVRQINAEMQMRPFQGVGELKQAIFVICKIELASVPAQNALLKSLEEPPAHVQFLLTSNQPQRLLPTILSRVQIVESAEYLKSDSAVVGTIDVQKLSAESYSALMELAGSYKEKADAVSYVKELLNTLHQDNIGQPTNTKTQLIISTVEALDYLNKNVNTRLVLEHLLFQFKSA